LCFGISSFDVCCACNTTCSTPSSTYLVSNIVSEVDVQIFYYDENGVLTSNTLPYGSVDVPYCSIGLPFASNNTIKIAVVFDYCGCGT